jgi:hypothetical protein
VIEDLIYGLNIYAVHYENIALRESLRKFIGSQEIVTGLIDLFSGMFLLYLFYVMGQLEMIAVGATNEGRLLPKQISTTSINMEKNQMKKSCRLLVLIGSSIWQ